MSINAVENYVYSKLNGLASYQFPNAQAWVLPPSVTYLTTPQLYVWGGVADETRHTLPRGLGEKHNIFQLTVYLQAATSNSIDPAAIPGPDAFPVLIDTVMATLRSITIPVAITDPITGAASIIQTIGEHIGMVHPTPIASVDQAWLWHNATLKVWITEEFQG